MISATIRDMIERTFDVSKVSPLSLTSLLYVRSTTLQNGHAYCGSPSQHDALNLQLGHNHRVATGEKKCPQASHSIIRKVVYLVMPVFLIR